MTFINRFEGSYDTFGDEKILIVVNDNGSVCSGFFFNYHVVDVSMITII